MSAQNGAALAPNTIFWWAERKQWPQWLAAAMQAGRPLNLELSELEAERLAREVAGLPLGRPQPHAEALSRIPAGRPNGTAPHPAAASADVIPAIPLIPEPPAAEPAPVIEEHTE